MEPDISLSNNPSATKANTECSYDLSQLGIFTGSKKNLADESSSSDPGDGLKEEKLDKVDRLKIENMKV
jgi:hypothetical protein